MNTNNNAYCHNCEQSCQGRFCPACGQRTSVHKVNFKETFQDLADQLLSLSAPLPQTLKMLVINPGYLLRDYLYGKRRRYYRPISFFLLTTLFYLIIRGLVGSEGLGQIIGDPKDNPFVDSDFIYQAREFMIENINSLLFIFVAVLALAMKLFYHRYYSLAEYFAVSFYLIGFYMLLVTLNLFYIRYVNQNIQYLSTLVMNVYFVYAMVSFFGHRKWLTSIKAFIAYILAYVFYILLASILSYNIIALKQL